LVGFAVRHIGSRAGGQVSVVLVLLIALLQVVVPVGDGRCHHGTVDQIELGAKVPRLLQVVDLELDVRWDAVTVSCQRLADTCFPKLPFTYKLGWIGDKSTPMIYVAVVSRLAACAMRIESRFGVLVSYRSLGMLIS